MSKMFNGNLNFSVDYKIKDLIDLSEFKTFLVKEFPTLVDNINQQEANLIKLENIYYHLIQCGDRPDDILNKFLLVVDNKIVQFFEQFDRSIIERLPLEVGETNPDFDFSALRKEMKKEIIKVSNKIFDNLINQNVPAANEKKIIKQIEEIIRSFQFLKQDATVISQITLVKYGSLLQMLSQPQPDKPKGSYGQIVDLNVSQAKFQIKDSQFDRTYPVFLHKKDMVVERIHDLLKEKDDMLHEIDVKQLIKSCLNRERRKIHREIYNQVIKQAKEQDQKKQFVDLEEAHK